MSLRHFFKKNLLTIFSVLFLILFSFVLNAYATPPDSPFTPGETLNPACAPTDTNCKVGISSFSGWGLTGNSGTDPATNFIGTTDDVPLVFKENNKIVGKIDENSENIFFGRTQNTGGTGSFNSAFGSDALYSITTGIGNTAIGSKSLSSNTEGNNNTVVGFGSLNRNIGGGRNIALGNNAGYYETGSDNLYIDNQSRADEADGRLKSLIYGKFGVDVLGQFVNINGALGIIDSNGSYYSIFRGGSQLEEISYTLPVTQGGINTFLENDGSGVLTWASGGTVANAWDISGNAGTIDGSNFIGTKDDVPLTFKVNNELAGRIDNTLENIFLGYQAGNLNITGSYNVAIGTQAFNIDTTGSNNVAIGQETLYYNTTGSSNVGVGEGSLGSNSTGDNNVAIGEGTLFTNTGSNNVALGGSAGYYETTSNNLYIDNQERGSEAEGRLKSLIYGKFDADPANQFVTINGKLNVSNGDVYVENSANGIILKSATDNHCARVTLTGASGSDALNYADITCP